MVRRRWKDPTPSAVQTQEPKTKVSPRLKVTVGLMKMEAVVSAIKPYEGFGDVDHTIKELMSL
jgi:hypothetical protein